MNLFNMSPTFDGKTIMVIFFKIFSVVFSLMYFIYALVVSRQIKTMSKTVQISDTGIVKRESLIIIITNFQVLISFITLIFSILIAFS